MIERALRAARLDASLFREVGQDDSKTGEAFLVVALATAINGLSTIIGPGRFTIGGWIGEIIAATALGFTIWTGIVFLVGKLFDGKAGYMNLLRGLGYATAPAAIGIIPFIGGLIGGIWSLIAQIRAVREINEVSDGKAVATVLIPFAVVFVIVLIFAAALLATIGFAIGGSN